MVRRLILAAAISALALAAISPARAATYQGRSVDGPRYHAKLMNNDYGSYPSVEVRFQGDRATVYFPAGGRIVLTLQDEDIVDPHAIRADDARRGITWDLDVHGLHGR